MKFFNEIFPRNVGPTVLAQPALPHVGVRLFRVETARGRFLAADADGVVGLAEAGGGSGGLVLCVPEGGGQASFLLAADGRAIGVEGDGFVGPAVSARLRRVEGRAEAGGLVELRHPLAPVRYLGVVFGADGRADRVLFDRVGDRVLNRLTLHAVGDAVLGLGGRALVGEIALAAGAPMTTERVLALLLGGRVRKELAEGLLRALPGDELQILAERLMQGGAELALLQLAAPGDPYIGRVLPALLAWEKAGRPATRQAVSAASDEHVCVLQAAHVRPQLGLAVNGLVRRRLSARHGAAVLAAARNEGAYLLDWVAHHKAAGFARVVIYSNGNDDGSDELLGLLAKAGEITWVRNELSLNARPQWKAYGHAFQMLPDLLDCRWAMVLDLDEYFSFDSGLFGSVGELIAWLEYQPVDAVALRRVNFVSGQADRYGNEPSTQRLVLREANPGNSFKTMVRPGLFWDSHRHFPYAVLDQPFTYRTEDGAPFQPVGAAKGGKTARETAGAEYAWVAHHAFRTPGEALMKVARGGATSRGVGFDEAARLNDVVGRASALSARPELVADRRTLECAPGAAAETARLRLLPGVMECDASVRRRYGESVAAVSRVFADAPPRAGQSETYAAFRAMLVQQGRGQ